MGGTALLQKTLLSEANPVRIALILPYFNLDFVSCFPDTRELTMSSSVLASCSTHSRTYFLM